MFVCAVCHFCASKTPETAFSYLSNCYYNTLMQNLSELHIWASSCTQHSVGGCPQSALLTENTLINIHYNLLWRCGQANVQFVKVMGQLIPAITWWLHHYLLILRHFNFNNFNTGIGHTAHCQTTSEMKSHCRRGHVFCLSSKCNICMWITTFGGERPSLILFRWCGYIQEFRKILFSHHHV